MLTFRLPRPVHTLVTDTLIEKKNQSFDTYFVYLLIRKGASKLILKSWESLGYNNRSHVVAQPCVICLQPPNVLTSIVSPPQEGLLQQQWWKISRNRRQRFDWVVNVVKWQKKLWRIPIKIDLASLIILSKAVTSWEENHMRLMRLSPSNR